MHSSSWKSTVVPGTGNPYLYTSMHTLFTVKSSTYLSAVRVRRANRTISTSELSVARLLMPRGHDWQLATVATGNWQLGTLFPQLSIAQYRN